MQYDYKCEITSSTEENSSCLCDNFLSNVIVSCVIRETSFEIKLIYYYLILGATAIIYNCIFETAVIIQ